MKEENSKKTFLIFWTFCHIPLGSDDSRFFQGSARQNMESVWNQNNDSTISISKVYFDLYSWKFEPIEISRLRANDNFEF